MFALGSNFEVIDVAQERDDLPLLIGVDLLGAGLEEMEGLSSLLYMYRKLLSTVQI